MTLEEYKRQSKEIYEAARNFSGTTQEEAVEFFEKIAQKYPEVTQFNEEAMQCKNIDEFRKLADKFGLTFSSEESAKKLFSILADSKKQLEALVKNHENGAELSDDELDAVTGGEYVVKGSDLVTNIVGGLGFGMGAGTSALAGATAGAMAGGPVGALVGLAVGAVAGIAVGAATGTASYFAADALT